MKVVKQADKRINKFIVVLLLLGAITIMPGINAVYAQTPTTAITIKESSYAQGASEVAFGVSFSVDTSLTAGQLINLYYPIGLVLPSSTSDYFISDSTHGSDSGTATGVIFGNGYVGVKIPAPISAGDAVILNIYGVTNPTAGSYSAWITTQTDTTSKWGTFTVVAPGSVSTPSVTLSTESADAQGVEYQVGFSLSPLNGALIGGMGSITLSAPPGTIFPSSINDYSLVDTTSPAASGTPTNVNLNSNSSTVTMTMPHSTTVEAKEGDSLQLTVENVGNPAPSPSGGYTVYVSTSSDNLPVPSQNYTIVNSSTVTSPTVTLTSYSAGAQGVTYVVNFYTSLTYGELVAGYGSITISAPAGTILPSPSSGAGAYMIGASNWPQCTSTSQQYCVTPTVITTFDNSTRVTLFLGITAPANISASSPSSPIEVELIINGVTNPDSPSNNYTLSVSTSSDIVPSQTPSYSILPQSSVSAPTLVSTTTTAAGATGVTYQVGFTTSSQGELMGQPTSFQGTYGSISLQAPFGTVFPSSASDYTVVAGSTTVCGSGPSVPSGTPTCPSVELAANGSTATVGLAPLPPVKNQQPPPPPPVPVNTAVTVMIGDVTNPPVTSTADTINVSTSSDIVPVPTGSYSITATNGLTSVSVAPSSTTAGASSNWTISVTPSSTGELIKSLGTITISAPVCTVFPTSGYSITDSTTPSGTATPSNVTLLANGTAVVLTVGGTVIGGDSLSIVINKVTNPLASGTIDVATSSDQIQASSSLTVSGTPSSPCSNSGSFSTPAASVNTTGSTATPESPAGAVSVAYSINFTLPFDILSGGPGTGGDVTLVAPFGTVFPSSSSDYYLSDSSAPSKSASASSAVLADSGSMVTLTFSQLLASGDVVTLTVGDVINPPTPNSSYALQVMLAAAATSNSVCTPTSPCDETSFVPSTTYNVTASTKLTPPTVVLNSTSASASQIVYTVGAAGTMTGSTEGELGGHVSAGNIANLGTVTIVTPPGTILPSSSSSYQITDTTNSSADGTATAVSVSDNFTVATVTVPHRIAASDTWSIGIVGVLTPGTPGSSYTISTYTSTDITPATSTSYSVTPITTPQNLKVIALSSTTGNAGGTTYQFAFSPSATGGLIGGVGNITIAASPGTIFPPSTNDYTITDTTTPSATAGVISVAVAAAGAQASVTIKNTQNSIDVNSINPGDSLTLTVQDVVSTLPGTSSFDLSTSSDISMSTSPASYTTTTPNSVSKPQVGLSFDGTTTPGVSYTVQFATSTTGGLIGGFGSITLSAPPGTFFPISSNDYTLTVGGTALNTPSIAVMPGSSTVMITLSSSPPSGSSTSSSIPAGTAVTLLINDMESPATPGTYSLTVSTSSDITPVATAPYTITQSNTGSYTPLVPYRICDTRAGNPSKLSGTDAQCNGTNNAGDPLGSALTTTIQVAGTNPTGTTGGGVPLGAVAVVLNVTAIQPTTNGFLTIWPAGSSQPTASSLNFTPSDTVPNLVEVALGSSSSCTGCISIYNHYGVTNIAVDVEGYVTSGYAVQPNTSTPAPLLPGVGLLNPIAPYRICDTRSGNPSKLSGVDAQCDGKNNSGMPVGAGQTLNVTVGGTYLCTTTSCPAPTSTTPQVPSNAAAVVLNVTAIGGSAPLSYLDVWPTGSTRPTASNLNFVANQIVPNAVVVPLGTGGSISIYNNSGSVNVAVDVSGWYSPGPSTTAGVGGTMFTGITPYRICDTRSATSTPSRVSYTTECTGKTLGGTVQNSSGQTTNPENLSVQMTGVGPIPSVGVQAVVLNVTVTNTTKPSFLTVWPSGASQSTVSSLNWLANQTIPNFVTVGVGSNGQVNFYNHAGACDIAVDVVGWYS
ncbi:MAG: hypothetical protein M1483_00440 [Actinobacteria bacterium]|nr:hypothetical protein [Actinomycetota bacterium]MCL6104102.1 hypothetical protein [Actinomycetota bacterium]